jgi:Tfp pilus tip-associated adhesin PilY1
MDTWASKQAQNVMPIWGNDDPIHNSAQGGSSLEHKHQTPQNPFTYRPTHLKKKKKKKGCINDLWTRQVISKKIYYQK